MYHFGTKLTYFPYHMKDEDLAFVPYVCEGAAKFLYVFNPFNCDGFERAVAS